MEHFFATVLPGLEHVLEDEIRIKLADARIQSIERGKVYFTSNLSVEAFMVLRTADNLYRLIHRFWVGPHKAHLAGIEHEISRLDLSWAYMNHRPGKIGFKVNASRMGKQTYSRFDAADAAARGIAKRDSRYKPVMDGTNEMEFRLDIYHEDAVFALRLTDATFRYRKDQRQFTHAALRPTVAHALVWLSKPEETDLFVDPFCGSGTIIAERLSYPYAQIHGGDLSHEAVEASQENAGSHENVFIRHWDARQLPLDSDNADKMVTNLPFGRQISANENIPELYFDVFQEMKRVLKANGLILCLTDADDAMQIAAERVQFSCRKEATLSLKGLHPTIYSLRKV